jgi:uncharacterized protein (TIGR02271 family)
MTEGGGLRRGSTGDVNPSVVRREEELELGTDTRELGRVRARKAVHAETVQRVADRRIEHAMLERARAEEDDSGEVITLPDGSVSIPVFEEQLVISKRLVVRERVILRKHTTTEQRRIEATLRRERVEVTGEGGAVVEDGGDAE